MGNCTSIINKIYLKEENIKRFVYTYLYLYVEIVRFYKLK